MIEHPNSDTDTSMDVVDSEARKDSNRFRLAKVKRPKSMRNRAARKASTHQGSIRQRRNKRYF